jgi:hypothetical protein
MTLWTRLLSMIDIGLSLHTRRLPATARDNARTPDSVALRRGRAPVLWILAVTLLGISACSPDGSGAGNPGPQPEGLASLDAAVPGDLPLGEIAETMALNGRATQLQRERIERRAIGAIVQWEMIVYDVVKDGSAYRILSQPIPITDPDAVSLLRILAMVYPRSERDHGRMAELKTGDRVAIKGIAQEIVMRTLITVSPARLASEGEKL